jgi:predicted DNA-binding transcriptional regulator AlpA
MSKTERQPGRDAGKDFLTRHDVAERLECCPKHVSRMARDGVIPEPLRLGRLLRWPRKPFEAWAACGCRPPYRPGR